MRILITAMLLAVGAVATANAKPAILAPDDSATAKTFSDFWLVRDDHGFEVNARDLYDRLINLPKSYAQIPLSDPKRYAKFVDQVFLQKRLAIQGEAWLRKHRNDPHTDRFQAAMKVMKTGTRREKDEYFSTFFLDREVERQSPDVGEQAQEYFLAHPEEFTLDAGRKFVGIEVNPAPGRATTRNEFYSATRDTAHLITEVARKDGLDEALHYCSELALSGTLLNCHKITFNTNDPLVVAPMKRLLMKIKQQNVIGEPLAGKTGWVIFKWVGSFSARAQKYPEVAARIKKLLLRDYQTNLRMEAAQRYQSYDGFETSADNIRAGLDALRKAVGRWPGKYSPEYLAGHPQAGKEPEKRVAPKP